MIDLLARNLARRAVKESNRQAALRVLLHHGPPQFSTIPQDDRVGQVIGASGQRQKRGRHTGGLS
jgi:hypothetical protein